MKLPIALGIAIAGLTVAAAAAQSNERHVVITRHGGGDVNLDANDDGWVTRAEASAAYERIFNDLDTNDDGRLDDGDRRQIHARNGNSPAVRVLRHGDGERREVRVVTSGELSDEDEARIEAQVAEAMARADASVERAERSAEHAERRSEEAERRAEHIERQVERATEHAEREGHHGDGERHVVIIRSNGGEAQTFTLDGDDADIVTPMPPMPPMPPVAPFMMLIANSEEADLNNDGALNLEEFRNMHLRFFDASDANGDGRVRFEEPPAPPEPPTPPTPPEPPRRR